MRQVIYKQLVKFMFTWVLKKICSKNRRFEFDQNNEIDPAISDLDAGWWRQKTMIWKMWRQHVQMMEGLIRLGFSVMAVGNLWLFYGSRKVNDFVLAFLKWVCGALRKKQHGYHHYPPTSWLCQSWKQRASQQLPTAMNEVLLA